LVLKRCELLVERQRLVSEIRLAKWGQRLTPFARNRLRRPRKGLLAPLGATRHGLREVCKDGEWRQKVRLVKKIYPCVNHCRDVRANTRRSHGRRLQGCATVPHSGDTALTWETGGSPARANFIHHGFAPTTHALFIMLPRALATYTWIDGTTGDWRRRCVRR
jgi:hypothetical protein